MRRALAGLRAARIRPEKGRKDTTDARTAAASPAAVAGRAIPALAVGRAVHAVAASRAVRISAAAAGALLLAACGPAEPGGPAAATPPPAAATITPSATPAPTITRLSPTPSPSPRLVAVPDVVGLDRAGATGTLRTAGVVVRTVFRRTSAYPAGRVLAVSPGAGTRLRPGSVVTLTVAQSSPPPPPTTAAPGPKPAPTTAAPRDCDPAYPDVCLKDGIGDYDCSSGSGNGPNYVRGPIRVLPPDPFGLDGNGDGVGCERG